MTPASSALIDAATRQRGLHRLPEATDGDVERVAVPTCGLPIALAIQRNAALIQTLTSDVRRWMSPPNSAQPEEIPRRIFAHADPALSTTKDLATVVAD
ncbi:hypothetical protein [Pseudoxanthomonas sp. JBR18]|uniref:hypothetical protein n=1 Tax=Pseudoxanthomonas sp. JBR18 TaxID=2969308 RepID=UPI002305A199|nr:hypothetical protein [Pseudoxanthomonas sp. JBR18]WCE02596.1 hypothetical protein PJ250_10550 [Pseudoxanthomonas sp. JBR18]